MEGDMEENVEGCGGKNVKKLSGFDVIVCYKLTILTMKEWR